LLYLDFIFCSIYDCVTSYQQITGIADADMLVQLLMDCTCQEINYVIRIKQKQYMEMESLSRIFCYDMHVSRLRQMAGKEYR
jgi:uncharacterized membrane protein